VKLSNIRPVTVVVAVAGANLLIGLALLIGARWFGTPASPRIGGWFLGAGVGVACLPLLGLAIASLFGKGRRS
jgi:hypothetical protein